MQAHGCLSVFLFFFLKSSHSVSSTYGITLPNYKPEQIHIAYAEATDQISVTWSTADDPGGCAVQYGTEEGSLDASTAARTHLFADQGPAGRVQFLHKAKLGHLGPQRKYYYRVGSDRGWSEVFHFRTPRSDADWSPRFLVYGDMGADNAQSLTRLTEEVQRGVYDAVLHVGDFAYDLDEDDGRVGDRFMRQIEPIAAHVPYMTTVGNHEANHNFSHYKNRFFMPGTENNMFYSYDIGPIHFITISTEFYYYLEYGLKPVALQYEWLVEDLRRANLERNRRLRPWIIVTGHRPMYCSNDDHDDCTGEGTLVRVGLPVFRWFALEPLLYEYGVDLAIWAHEHSYERLWPVYNRTVANGSSEEPYVNPRAPVHVTTGSAGCREEKDGFVPEKPDWTAFRSSDYGYSRLAVVNGTHLHLEQVSDDKAGRVIDAFWLVRERHGPYRPSA